MNQMKKELEDKIADGTATKDEKEMHVLLIE